MSRVNICKYYSRTVADVNTKTLVLKVPVVAAGGGISPAKRSPRLSSSLFGDKEEEDLLQQFVVEKAPSSHGVVKPFNGLVGAGGSAKKRTQVSSASTDVSNAKLKAIVENFSLPATKQLPLVKPKIASLASSPYEFFVRHNGDESIKQIPRLSVTKLLTKSWCELREYYDVYAGSVARQRTVQMERGTEHHNKLELAVHEKIDVSALQDTLVESEAATKKVMEEKLESAKLEGDVQLAERLEKESKQISQLLEGEKNVNTLAGAWTNDIIRKLYTLLVTSQAREVLVHSYVNFENESLVAKSNDFPLNEKDDVLVSGIIDLLEITNPGCSLELFKDVQNWIEYTYISKGKVMNGLPMVDLSEYFEEYTKLVQTHFGSEKYQLRITDVKTRSRKIVPPQNSVISAAKQQVSYYKKYLDILSGKEGQEMNGAIGYNMLLENARRRHCDVDQPIGLHTVVELLRTNSYTLFEDFMKLANGEKIGFEEYDNFVQEKYLNPSKPLDHAAAAFDLSHLLDVSGNLSLEVESGFEYTELLKPLLKEWRVPLTLRYFAARSGQFYSQLQPFLQEPLVSVDYHYNKTGESFKRVDFEYASETFERNLAEAVGFWKGTRAPEVVDDVGKCKYCDFQSRCSIPNPHLTFSLGKQIQELWTGDRSDT